MAEEEGKSERQIGLVLTFIGLLLSLGSIFGLIILIPGMTILGYGWYKSRKNK